jgi:hypothetical protein
MVASTEPGDEPGAAVERAVQWDREAIKLHGSAAQYLEKLAARLERDALRDEDERLRTDALEVVAKARRRAQSARQRAATTTRTRLRDIPAR